MFFSVWRFSLLHILKDYYSQGGHWQVEWEVEVHTFVGSDLGLFLRLNITFWDIECNNSN